MFRTMVFLVYMFVFISGEKMDEKELVACLRSLLGVTSGSQLMDCVPTTFTPENFSLELLGFEDYELSE